MLRPVILDANSLIVRCILASALDDLHAGGMFTGGVYGALGSLRAFLTGVDRRFLGPVVAFFDAGIPPFRRELLPDYKKKRAEKKQRLTKKDKKKAFKQMKFARTMFSHLGVLCLSYKDREADDCVGAAVSFYVGQCDQPVVVTGDKDLWQVVQLGVPVWDLNKKRWIRPENFAEIVGVAPRTYALYKALLGDPSDSIAGAPGCGKKRARQLIDELSEDPGFKIGEPTRQLDYLRRLLAARVKPKKFELGIFDNVDYLKRVLRATSIWRGFGKRTGLEKRLREFRPEVKAKAFLQLCKRLQFRSVLGDPERVLVPFRRAAGRVK